MYEYDNDGNYSSSIVKQKKQFNHGYTTEINVIDLVSLELNQIFLRITPQAVKLNYVLRFTIIYRTSTYLYKFSLKTLCNFSAKIENLLIRKMIIGIHI